MERNQLKNKIRELLREEWDYPDSFDIDDDEYIKSLHIKRREDEEDLDTHDQLYSAMKQKYGDDIATSMIEIPPSEFKSSSHFVKTLN